jgi:hypothetical protein
LTKTLVDSALEGEMDDHLSYSKHSKAGPQTAANRALAGAAGRCRPTWAGGGRCAAGPDRTFEPRLVPTHARRLSGIEDLVISLSAKGLTTGEIAAHLGEVWGASVSKQTVSRITDRVLDGRSPRRVSATCCGPRSGTPAKRDWSALAKDLKPVCTAASEQADLDAFAATWEAWRPPTRSP